MKITLLRTSAIIALAIPAVAHAQSTGTTTFDNNSIVVTAKRAADVGGVKVPDTTKARNVLGQDFIRTARAKGLAEHAVLFGHALRNALIPLVTLLGVSLPHLLGGAIIVEQIFQWPGMGRLAIEAISQRDYPVLMGLNLMTAGLVVTGSLLADILYAVIDPRIRLR